MQSPEYPDLKWMPPAAFGTGRDGKAVRYVVIHYTAGSERSTSAEDGAVFDQNRDDGTSTHYFVDQNSIVQCVQTKNRGNAARHRGNRLGIQYELCGTVQTRAQWLDAASLATLKLAAKQVARDCRKYDIPVRRLSVAQTRAAWTDFPDGPKGIVGHVDCTRAYPEDGGDHTDPGTEFPWDVFLDLVRAEMDGDTVSAADVITALKSAEGKAAVYAAVNQDKVQRYDSAGVALPADPAKPGDEVMTWASALAYLGRDAILIRKAVSLLAAKDTTDEAAIVAGVLAGLDPAAIAAAIPPELARQVADELATRLQD